MNFVIFKTKGFTLKFSVVYGKIYLKNIPLFVDDLLWEPCDPKLWCICNVANITFHTAVFTKARQFVSINFKIDIEITEFFVYSLASGIMNLCF